MKTSKRSSDWRLSRLAIFLGASLVYAGLVCGQSAPFTYQGRLDAAGQGANGTYDFTFTLYTANAGGESVAGPATNLLVAVTNGLFTTPVDFGPGVFTGANYWLEVGVRSNGVTEFSTLAPRQPITAVPYALHAADSAALGGQSAGDWNGAIAGQIATATNQLSATVQPGSVNLTNWSGRTTNSFVAASGGVMTNVTLSTGNATASFSNSAGVWPALRFDAKTNTYLHIDFTATGQSGPGTNVGVSMNYWPQHNFTQPQVASEFVLTADGSIALGAHWFQIGVGAWMPAFMEFFDQQVNPNTNLMDSIPLVFRARYYSNGVLYASGSRVGGPGYSDTQYEAALHYRALDTNGNGGFGFYNALNNNQHNGTWSHTGSSMQHQFVVGPEPGLQVTGYIQANGLRGITTNRIIGGEVWQITDGLITSIAPIDPDMLGYLSRLGPVSSTVTNALITFVATLKASGVWSNLDFIYPMLGTNINTDCLNLVTNQFNGVPHGAFTTADATGVQSDGSSGYIDTGWRGTNSPSNCGMFVFLKNNSASINSKVPMGARDSAGTTYIAMTQAGSTTFFWLDIYNSGHSLVASASVTPVSMLIQRTSSTSKTAYVNGVSIGSNSETATNPPACNVFICAMDNNGTAQNYFDGKVQVAAGLRTSLSASQAATLHNACAALNTALGR
jgi:hypothetical protein